ncbi:MAG: hypothetical protein EAZ18_23850 [Oscillatoriales cyanobacterium]|nr:MAG: hypothetical protein EAZ18_23850 [Oscillatoriales cyanobacterium]
MFGWKLWFEKFGLQAFFKGGCLSQRASAKEGIGQRGHWPKRALAKEGIGQRGHWALAKEGIGQRGHTSPRLGTSMLFFYCKELLRFGAIGRSGNEETAVPIGVNNQVKPIVRQGLKPRVVSFSGAIGKSKSDRAI